MTLRDGDADVAVAADRSDAVTRSEDADVTERLFLALDAPVTVATDNGDVDAAGLDAPIEDAEGDAWADVTDGDGTHELETRTDIGDVTLTSLA